MKYYFIAGERSGDLHAGNVIRELKNLDNTIEVRAWGGDVMQAAGATLVKHYTEMAFMGFVEVLLNLTTISRFLKECKQDILTYKPDIVVLVDYGGFNMKIAKFAKENGFEVHYYIPPKVWAWNTGRVKKIKKYVDKVYSILPFEVDFFQKHGVTVEFVGNPSYDEISEFNANPDFKSQHQLSDKPILALLPGSRKQEILLILELMAVVASEQQTHQVVVAGVSNLPKELYAKCEAYGFKIIYDSSFEILNIADKALVTSGTASLETCLFQVPHIVCYQTNYITGKIARFVIKVNFVSLVNLIANKEVVRELLVDNFNYETLTSETKKLLQDQNYIQQIKDGYQEVLSKIGKKGAPKTVAKLLFNKTTKVL